MPEVLENVQIKSEEPVEDGDLKTKADDLYLDIAADSLKKTGDRLQDSLQKLATLAAALAGGGFVVRDDLMSVYWRVGTILVFLFSLVFAVLGTKPAPAEFQLDHIGQCRNFAVRTWERKWCWLRVSMATFLLAFLIALIGLVVRQISPQATNPS